MLRTLHLRTKQLVVTGSVILVVFVVCVVFALIYRGNTKHIESVADRFKTPSHWLLETEKVTPPRIVCLGDDPCPSLHRDWVIEDLPSRSDLETVLKASKMNFPIEGDCDSTDTHGTPGLTCQAQGSIDSYRVKISILGTTTPEYKNHVVLSVRPM